MLLAISMETESVEYRSLIRAILGINQKFGLLFFTNPYHYYVQLWCLPTTFRYGVTNIDVAMLQRKPMRRNLQFSLIGFILFTLVVWSSSVLLYAAIVVPMMALPSDVVQQWLMAYPKDLESAAKLTTPKFRHEQSPEEWIVNIQAAGKDQHFEYGAGELLSEKIEETQARLVINVAISSVYGEQQKQECYDLVKIDSQWLIDDIQETEKISMRK